jgi:hypothetical protein
VSCLRDSHAISGEGSEDLIRCLYPHVGAGVLVPSLDPILDVALELGDREVRRALDLLGGRLDEPALHELSQLDPVGVKWRWNLRWRNS